MAVGAKAAIAASWGDMVSGAGALVSTSVGVIRRVGGVVGRSRVIAASMMGCGSEEDVEVEDPKVRGIATRKTKKHEGRD